MALDYVAFLIAQQHTRRQFEYERHRSADARQATPRARKLRNAFAGWLREFANRLEPTPRPAARANSLTLDVFPNVNAISSESSRGTHDYA